ncbi:MAG: hypothetical protein WAX38_02965 [Minisyncoccia bacterium]
MVNLLTPDMRARSTSSFWSRVGLLWTGALVTALIIGLLALLPAFETTRTGSSTLVGDANTKKARERAELMEVELNNSQILSSILEEHVRGSDVVPVLTMVRVLQKKYEPGVTFSEYKTTRNALGLVDVEINGVSKDRDALINLAKAIEQEKGVTNLVLPLSDLAGRQGSYPFAIKFTVQL